MVIVYNCYVLNKVRQQFCYVFIVKTKMWVFSPWCRFGYGSVKRVVAWLNESVPKEVKILDIGCGNGIMLIDLVRIVIIAFWRFREIFGFESFHAGVCWQFKNGYRQLFGVDYCIDAVNLARAIAEEKNATSIQYDVCIQYTLRYFTSEIVFFILLLICDLIETHVFRLVIS